MSQLKKALVLFGIALLAIVTALPFVRRRDSSSPAVDVSSEQTELPWITRGNVVPLQIQGEPPATEDPTTTAENSDSTFARESTNEQRSFITPPTLSAQPKSPSGNTSESRRPGQLIRHHKIVDGDTLLSLAETYLGNSARWEEIFRANEKWIADSNILPLGFEIVIPGSAE